MGKSQNALPFHIRGSKVEYKTLRGAKLIMNAFTDEDENRAMHANIPQVPDARVNKFFKDRLGLDKRNLLVATVSLPSRVRHGLLLPGQDVQNHDQNDQG